MTRVATAFVSRRAVAEEVVQETWLNVVRGLDGFEGKSSLRTWIYAILCNCARRRAEQEQRLVPLSELGADEAAGDDLGVSGYGSSRKVGGPACGRVQWRPGRIFLRNGCCRMSCEPRCSKRSTRCRECRERRSRFATSRVGPRMRCASTLASRTATSESFCTVREPPHAPSIERYLEEGAERCCTCADVVKAHHGLQRRPSHAGGASPLRATRFDLPAVSFIPGTDEDDGRVAGRAARGGCPARHGAAPPHGVPRLEAGSVTAYSSCRTLASGSSAGSAGRSLEPGSRRARRLSGAHRVLHALSYSRASLLDRRRLPTCDLPASARRRRRSDARRRARPAPRARGGLEREGGARLRARVRGERARPRSVEALRAEGHDDEARELESLDAERFVTTAPGLAARLPTEIAGLVLMAADTTALAEGQSGLEALAISTSARTSRRSPPAADAWRVNRCQRRLRRRPLDGRPPPGGVRGRVRCGARVGARASGRAARSCRSRLLTLDGRCVGDRHTGFLGFARLASSEMRTAPTRAMPRPIQATATCHRGLLRRSSSRRTPSRMPTTGFATETVATEGASRPVPRETCCSTKPSTPAIASAYGSQ